MSKSYFSYPFSYLPRIKNLPFLLFNWREEEIFLSTDFFISEKQSPEAYTNKQRTVFIM